MVLACVRTLPFNQADSDMHAHVHAHARTHTHTQGRVLGVSDWITSFRPCCIITSSAVINSDVPTGMRLRVLQRTLSARTHARTQGNCVAVLSRVSRQPLPNFFPFFFTFIDGEASRLLIFQALDNDAAERRRNESRKKCFVTMLS